MRPATLAAIAPRQAPRAAPRSERCLGCGGEFRFEIDRGIGLTREVCTSCGAGRMVTRRLAPRPAPRTFAATTFAGALEELQRAVGASELARQLGVADSVIWRWKRGVMPSGRPREQLRAYYPELERLLPAERPTLNPRALP